MKRTFLVASVLFSTLAFLLLVTGSYLFSLELNRKKENYLSLRKDLTSSYEVYKLFGSDNIDEDKEVKIIRTIQEEPKLLDYFDNDKIEQIEKHNFELTQINYFIYREKVDEIRIKLDKVEKEQELVENLNLINLEKRLDKNAFVTTLDISNQQITQQKIQDLLRERETLQELENHINRQFEQFISGKKERGEFINPLWLKTDEELKSIIANMSLSQKAGQLLMFSVQGNNLTGQDGSFRELNLGGVILMGYNVESSGQVVRFSNSIQSTNQQIPLFISTDQEGGPVKRIFWDETVGQSEWLNLDKAQICDLAKERAKTLYEVNINLNFSPVADLTNINTAFINHRTISSDPSIVSEKINEYIKCHQEQKVFTTLKHFPGHGSTIEDSHIVLPVIDKSRQEWEKSDLIPFKENLDSKFVMVGHLVYKQIDENSASTSKIFLTDILREELGYEGLVVTDGMGQLHASTGISVREALKQSINAGVDIVLYVSLPQPKEVVKAELENLIETGEISGKRVDESLLRILKIKRELK